MTADRPQGLIEDAGQAGKPRRLDQMVSARLDPPLVAALRRFAKRRGITFSDVIRLASLNLLAREDAQNVIVFSVRVTNETLPKAVTRSYCEEIPAAI